MRIRTYDLVFGLGTACSCTETLRKAGLQMLSFPYDWLAPICRTPEEAAHEIRSRVHELCDGFSTWFDKGDFRPGPPTPEASKAIYVNDRLHLIFNHDFPRGMPYDEAFDLVSARYRRRADRLIELIRSAHRILVVRMDRPGQVAATDVEDCKWARRELSRVFAPAQFDFFLFNYDKGRAYENRIEETVEDGFTRMAFDYRNYEPGRPDYQVEVELAGRVLASRFAARDYRTAEERRAFASNRRRKRFARLVQRLLRILGKQNPT